jgi:uracil-DNA glycosylase
MTNKTKLYLPTNMNPLNVRIIMISETFPENKRDYFYSKDSLYVTNTLKAFNNAGIEVKNIDDILKRGIYLTVSIKEPRKGLVVPMEKIKEYSSILEEELKLFPNLKVILLMGDTAIKVLNCISRHNSKTRVIPSGSTYKILPSNGEKLFDREIQTGYDCRGYS